MKPLRFSSHARFEMERRGITEAEVQEVALSPQQVIVSRKARAIHQSLLTDPGTGKEMLLRVVLMSRPTDWLVITAYKTSKLEKYRQGQS